jgi:hypothetical protein
MCRGQDMNIDKNLEVTSPSLPKCVCTRAKTLHIDYTECDTRDKTLGIFFSLQLPLQSAEAKHSVYYRLYQVFSKHSTQTSTWYKTTKYVVWI